MSLIVASLPLGQFRMRNSTKKKQKKRLNQIQFRMRNWKFYLIQNPQLLGSNSHLENGENWLFLGVRLLPGVRLEYSATSTKSRSRVRFATHLNRSRGLASSPVLHRFPMIMFFSFFGWELSIGLTQD